MQGDSDGSLASPASYALTGVGWEWGKNKRNGNQDRVSGGGLALVLSVLHCPASLDGADHPFAVLLEACRIAELWELRGALSSLATKMTSKRAAAAPSCDD